MRRLLNRLDALALEGTGQGMTEWLLIIVLILMLMMFAITMYTGKLGAAAKRAANAITNGECCTGHPTAQVCRFPMDRPRGGGS